MVEISSRRTVDWTQHGFDEKLWSSTDCTRYWQMQPLHNAKGRNLFVKYLKLQSFGVKSMLGLICTANGGDVDLGGQTILLCLPRDCL